VARFQEHPDGIGEMLRSEDMQHALEEHARRGLVLPS
jgi:hypothetical protein